MSKRKDVDGVLSQLQTVGLFVGPYRNLTTLTAAVLALHPRCQVLNHAGDRLLRGRKDFIGRYSDQRLRGDGPNLITALVAQNPKLRFLLPVRDPLACAMSNVRTTHAVWMGTSGADDPAVVVDRIAEMIAWFSAIADRHPDRCSLFYQDDAPEEICRSLASLLALEGDPMWVSAVETAFTVESTRYDYPPRLRSAFVQAVERHLANAPEVATRVMALTVSGTPTP